MLIELRRGPYCDGLPDGSSALDPCSQIPSSGRSSAGSKRFPPSMLLEMRRTLHCSFAMQSYCRKLGTSGVVTSNPPQPWCRWICHPIRPLSMLPMRKNEAAHSGSGKTDPITQEAPLTSKLPPYRPFVRACESSRNIHLASCQATFTPESHL